MSKALIPSYYYQPMESAPRFIEILGRYKKGKPMVIHYAEGGGEEQPYYQGWFTKYKDYDDYYSIQGNLDDWEWKLIPEQEVENERKRTT